MGLTAWNQTTKRLVVIGVIVVLLLVFYFFRQLLPVIVVAVIISYVLKPIVDFLERRIKLPRTVATILVIVLVLGAISLIPVTGVPYAVERITRLNLDLQKLTNDLVSFLSQPIEILDYTINLEDWVGDIQQALQDLVQPFASRTVGWVFDIASSVLWVVSGIVITFYVIRDTPRFYEFLDRIAPPGHAYEFRRLRQEINQVWMAFFRGQVLLGVVIGVVVWLATTAVGLPSAGLMGLIAGLLEVIPNFGPTIATIPAVLIALVRGSTYLPISNFWFAVLIIAMYAAIQQVENTILVPRIMSRRLNLHPLFVFIGVLAGGLTIGVLGVLLAAPVLGTVRVILSYTYAKLVDQEPFPPEPEVSTEIYPGEIDAILFDLDGTLIETDDQAVESLAGRLRPIRWLLFGRAPHEVARYILMSLEGPANSLLTLLDRLGLDDEVLDLGNRLRALRGLDTPLNFRPVDGIAPMLHDLNRRYHLGIVTTRSHDHAEMFCRQQGLQDLIQVIVGREDTWRIKPHPSPIRYAADRLGYPVERCLMVGDTPVDIRAARQAGARSIGVLCGFGQAKELDAAGADKILDITSDLNKWL